MVRGNEQQSCDAVKCRNQAAKLRIVSGYAGVMISISSRTAASTTIIGSITPTVLIIPDLQTLRNAVNVPQLIVYSSVVCIFMFVYK